MKLIKSRYFFVGMVMVLLFACLLVDAQAEVTYLGEYCVYDDSLAGRPPMPLFKIGVLSYGNNHFALNGNMIELPVPVSGSGMIDGNNFIATLTYLNQYELAGTQLSFQAVRLVVNMTPIAGSNVMSGTYSSYYGW